MMDIIQQLHFLRPEFFWLLPLVLGAFISLHLLRSKSSQWYDVVDPLLIEHLLDNPANNQASRRTNIPLVAATLACCIAVIAVAGPSWERLPNVTEQKTDAMIVITDLTLSMHATDIKPSRLVRTRYKLLELLKQRKDGQTALIAYSGDAHVVSPLTDDASTIAALIPSLSPDIMPSIGSNAVAAFNSATQLLKNSGINRAKIVWFTDEALPSDIKAIDNILNNKNNTITANPYQLIIIGIGSKAGGPIP
ncbi:MAG: VWA domain-containing protein, partial [Pseudomonadales bacterium]|nr:VWA domain-containing protein [Pseudomonadales bacterium]